VPATRLGSIVRAIERVIDLREGEMDSLLGGLAFTCLIVGQFLAVVAVHKMDWKSGFGAPHDGSDAARVRYTWLFGS
jgi:hypothetical protein